jgi:hypothetical protein
MDFNWMDTDFLYFVLHFCPLFVIFGKSGDIRFLGTNQKRATFGHLKGC